MASFDLKWWHAQANLAWRTTLHYLRKLWPWRERFGLERFRQNYVHEGLPPATETVRSLAHQPGRCTMCGLCDEVCPLMDTLPIEAFLGPMTFVISGARAAPHFGDVETTLRTLVGSTCQACRRCEDMCPEQIPITRLAEAMLGQLTTIEAAKRRHAEAETKALFAKAGT